MVRRRSIIHDPDFQWIAFFIGLLLIGSMIYNYNHGGLAKAIASVPVNLYNLAYGTIFIIFLIIVCFKWEFIKEILKLTAIWIWEFLTRKKRNF